MEFIAINLNDFHANQKDGKTNTEIVFLGAQNAQEAKQHISKTRPENAWFVLSKKHCDSNIVYRSCSEGEI